MTKFAFLVHPLSMDDIYAFEPKLKTKNPGLIRGVLLRWLPPFMAKEVEFTSPLGVSARGVIIAVGLLPEHFVSPNREEARAVIAKLEEAGKLAEGFGASVLGLGALTAVVGENGKALARKLGPAVTTGNSYTVAVAVRLIETLALKRRLNLECANLTIIGASGSIGKACARMMVRRVGRLTLIARNLGRLKDLAKGLAREGNLNVRLETDIAASLPASDIVILSTSDANLRLNRDLLQARTIVVNLSQPPNVDLNDSQDPEGPVLVDGGKVLPPPRRVVKIHNPHFPTVPGIDSEEIFSCYAETIILALARRNGDFSIGRNLALDRIQTISDLAEKHGFNLPQL